MKKKSEITKSRILDAAAKMFRQKGYEATTLKDIGEIVEINAAAIFYYFESKEKLFERVLHIGIDRIHDAVQQALYAAPPEATYRDRICLAIFVHLSTLLEHSDFTAANIINYGLAPRRVRASHHVHREAYGDCWRRLLSAAQEAGEIDKRIDLSLFRLFMIGGLDWSHEWYRPDQKSPEEIAADICSILFDGVQSSGKPRAN